MFWIYLYCRVDWSMDVVLRGLQLEQLLCPRFHVVSDLYYCSQLRIMNPGRHIVGPYSRLTRRASKGSLNYGIEAKSLTTTSIKMCVGHRDGRRA